MKYLAAAGLPATAVEEVGRLLGEYVSGETAAEDLQMGPRNQILTGGPRGPVGATDRRMARDELDQFGQPRRLLATAMSPGGGDQFSERFPDTSRLKVV
jgi:hypothetical protein